MNRFIIDNGLPFLYANGKAYRVRWNEKGFTVGAEVELASVPSVTYSELSIKAKCGKNLDSIGNIELATEQQEAPQDTVPDEEVTEQQEAPQELDNMTLAKLKEYANDMGIKLNGARTKAEIIKAITAAE